MRSTPEPRRRLRPLRLAGWVLAAALVALQPVACLHARALTTYVDGRGPRTPRPEDLGALAKLRTLACGVVLTRPRVRATPADAGLAYEDVAVEGEAGTLAAWLVPAGAPDPAGRAFLFPGHAAARDSLLGEAAELHALGWEVVLVDLRGCGGSAGDHTTLGWDEARDVVDAVTALRAGRTLLYGQSMGAAAVLRAVGTLGLRADLLVLEAPFDSLRNALRHRCEAMGLPTAGLPELLLFWGGVLRGFDAFAHRPADDARGVEAPALVLRGAADRRVRAADARRVADALAGPARLVELPGVGHSAGLRGAPAEWRAAVRAFLEERRGEERRVEAR